MHHPKQRPWIWQSAAILTTLLLLCGCNHESSVTSVPLVQRGYLWQRDWTPAVDDAVQQADRHLDGLIVLGAEIGWQDGQPLPIEATIDWPQLKALKRPVSLALRIAPYPGPFAEDDATAHAITAEAASLLAKARANGVEPQELEIDYDCATGKLKGYESWLRALGPTVHPTPLVITTLPAWLSQPEFPALARHAGSFVLQVHSVPTLSESGRASLCDPALARKWVDQAARIGVPFTVALPTYWCLAGFDPSGKLAGVAMDSVQPSWPAGTRMIEFGPDANALADLVSQWKTQRPSAMRGIIWYRLPVATDLRNWRWPTLLAVMAGQHPQHDLHVTQQGQAPVDLSIANAGNAEEDLHCDIVVHWNGPRPVACDALPGWSVTTSDGQAIFSTTDSYHLRLSPGTGTSIGWIRLAESAALQTELIPHEQKTP